MDYSYSKVIMYGDNIETFEYENRPPFTKKISAIKKEKLKFTEGEKFIKRKDNAMQAKANFRRLVGANLSDEKALLISLTYAENMQDISIGYKDYRSFVQALRYRFGENIKYIAVPEFQKRGAVHFHTLFWGMPREIFLKEKIDRTIAKIWGHGFVDIIETNGNGKLSSYLAKYMAKAFIDRRLKNQKAYVSSRNVKRPITDSMLLPLFYEHIEENAVPEIDRTYKTAWMGQCRHRLFKIKNRVL